MGSVTNSGTAEITNQLEYDDEVAYEATRKIYDLSRRHDERPWCLTVSFTHPHDPYLARKKYWDLYEDCSHLLPEVSAMSYGEHDPHSRRILDASDWNNFNISEKNIKNSRRAYFSNISYLDDKIGEILDTLQKTNQEAVIIFVSDHGDMIGERGLWFKMSFFESSSRVPLMISSTVLEPQLVAEPVSTLDVCSTLCDLAGCDMDEVAGWTEGESLLPFANGSIRTKAVMMEYVAEASYAPLISIRKGPFKYNRCDIDPEQLFDLESDPNELHNLASLQNFSEELTEFQRISEAKWDLASFDKEVRKSQAQRWIVYESLRNGEYYPWDFQLLKKASERFMRNHMDLNEVEERQRSPRE
jgi:choline-sulfatase